MHYGCWPNFELESESQSEFAFALLCFLFFWRGWTIWIWFHNNTLDSAGLGSSWIQSFFHFCFLSLTIWFVCWAESEMHWLAASRAGRQGASGWNYRFITIQTVRLSSRPLAASFAAIIMQFAAACCWASHRIALHSYFHFDWLPLLLLLIIVVGACRWPGLFTVWLWVSDVYHSLRHSQFLSFLCFG